MIHSSTSTARRTHWRERGYGAIGVHQLRALALLSLAMLCRFVLRPAAGEGRERRGQSITTLHRMKPQTAGRTPVDQGLSCCLSWCCLSRC